jgi:DNA-binding response OmpR family regulator
MSKNVLIAEDEKPLSHALSLKLTREGFLVDIAQNGQECLDMIKAKKYDVLLLDLMMPVIDGFQVLESSKKISHIPKIIVLSNLSQKEDEDRVLSLGASKYFIKSNVSLSQIVEEIKKV